VTTLVIPDLLKPNDGRFGSGPSKVPASALEVFAGAGAAIMGTSHRQAPVKDLVRRIRSGLAELFQLPEDYEIILGNGGSTALWDAMAFGLVRTRAQHVVCGEFSKKFAEVTAGAPFLQAPAIVGVEPGSGTIPVFDPDVDVYAWPQNETSTGVALPVQRVIDAAEALMVIDATSAAGGMEVDITQTDVYYFAPQKAFASDGGLWFAACSPAALARIEEIHLADRWIPPSLDLHVAVENSRKEQTYNTPALATLLLMEQQLNWMRDIGGVAEAAGRSAESSSRIYEWAAKSDYAEPFVQDPQWRSPVVVTVDLNGVEGTQIINVLRQNGIVDIDPYRALGRNQLRIGVYPAVDPDDVSALLSCIDWVTERL